MSVIFRVMELTTTNPILVEMREYIPQARIRENRFPPRISWRGSEFVRLVRPKQSPLRALGFANNEAFEQAQWFAGIPRQERERIRANYDRPRSAESEESDDRKSGFTEGGNEEAVDDRKRRRSIRDRTNDGQSEAPEHGDRRSMSASKAGRQFISYVAAQPDNEEPDPDGLDHEARMGLEEKAISRILAKDPSLHRTPTNIPGFDLFEADEDGKKLRWIEVKAMTGCLEDHPVGLSHTQFECARKLQRQGWRVSFDEHLLRGAPGDYRGVRPRSS